MSNEFNHLYEFDKFQLDIGQSALWCGEELVQVPPKVFDVLRLLVEKQGAVVSKEELMNSVWADAFVEESNLTQNIYTLRRTLGKTETGENFIENVPRRGYRFVTPVRIIEPENSPIESLALDHELSNSKVDAQPAKQSVSSEINNVSDTTPPISYTIENECKEISKDLNLSLNPFPKNQVRWHFIGLVLLGIFFLTSYALWWEFSNQKLGSSVSVADRNIRTLAILPLKTLNEGEKSKAVSLGVADSLISGLGKLNRLAVRPLNSVNDYLEAGKDPIEFGEELKVDAVLEGSLQVIDNRLRVNVRLWDVRDGAQLWQDSFDETETDIFTLQDALSARVTKSLVSTVLEKESELLAKRHTQNSEAFHSYWRGRFFLEKRTPEKAISEFEQAINLDPNYALAYAGLADAYTALATVSSGRDKELYDQAKLMTNKALELNSNLSDAYTSLARIKYWSDWDWAGSENSFRRAIELDPNNVNAHQFYARLLTTLGRYDEALAEIQRAREIDPRSADLAIPLFSILEKRGQFDEALKILKTSLEMDKDSYVINRSIGKIYLLKGEYNKVIELGNQLYPPPKETEFYWSSMLATAYRQTGQEEKAIEQLNHLQQKALKDPKYLYFLAMHYSEFGQKGEAIDALQNCLEMREERILWTKNEPRFASLYDDPRFQELLSKIKLN